MSDNLGAMLQRGYMYLTGEQPKLQAETAETYSRIPLNQAQASDALAHANYQNLGLTPKTQVEAEQIRIQNEYNRALNQVILPDLTGSGKLQQQGQHPAGWRPPDDGTGSSYGQPQTTQTPGGGGGGGQLPPAPSAAPGERTGDRMSYAAPTQPPSTALASAAPPGQSDPGTGSFFLGATTSEPVPTDQVPTITVRPPQLPPNAPGAAPSAGPRVPSAPAAIPAASGAPQPQQGGGYSNTQGSPNGTYSMQLGGMMVPTQLQVQYWQDLKNGKSATEAAAEAVAKRNNYLLSLVYGATDQPSWSRATEEAYDNGYLSDADYHAIHQNFDARNTLIRKLQPAVTAERDTGQLQRGYVYDPTKGTHVLSAPMHAGDTPEETGQIPGPGGTYITERTTPVDRAIRGGQPVYGLPGGAGTSGTPGTSGVPAAPGPGASAASPAVAAVAAVAPGPFADYAAAVHSHEGTSPTMGEFGWTPKTKVDMARKYAPQEVAGLTPVQIAEKQMSPGAETRMFQGFTGENAVTLQQAGIRPSGANLFMAHYIGANGVKNLATVSPDMTITEMERRGLVAPGTVAGNKELQGNVTAGSLVQYAQRLAGNNTITPNNIQGRSTEVGPGPGGTPGVPRPAAAPGGGAGGGGATYQSAPQRAPGVAQMIEHNINTDNKAVDDSHDAALSAQGAARTVNDMRNRVQPLREAGAFGYGAEFRTNAASLTHYLTGLLGKDNDLQKKFDSWNFENQGDREAFIKEATQIALQTEAAMPGVHSGIGLAAMVGKGTPNLNMQGDTVKELLDRMIVGHQMTIDYANTLHDEVKVAQDKFNEAPWTNPYNQPTQQAHDRDWNDAASIHNTKVYLAAANLLGGRPKDAWDKGLKDPQRDEAVAIARRADPSWVPVQGQ